MNNNQIGVILIILGMLFFSIQDAIIKHIVSNTSLVQIMVFRSIAGCLILSAFLFFSNTSINLSSSYPLIALTRGTLFFFGFTLFYISVSQIPLAEATSLFFVSPLFMTIFSKLILKSSIGLHRTFSIIIGFSGMLLIIKPGYETFNLFMVLPIITALTYSFSMILAKKTSDKDSHFQQTFHIYLAGIIIGIPLSLSFGWFPTAIDNSFLNSFLKPWEVSDIHIILSILVISVVGSLGIIFLISAYNIGSPMANAPSEYVILIFSFLIGYIIFREMPDIYSFIGIILIVISGIYIFLRENVKKEMVATKTTLRT